MTEQPSPLAAALAAVQAALPDVRKAETAHVRSEKGSYSYKYADLADITKAVLPLLGANGLAWICRPTLTEDQRFVLSYELRHVSGESIAGEYPLPSNGSPQIIGSAITYGRRYCLCAVTGVAADADDDGAAATAQHHGRPAEDPWETARPRPSGRDATYDANDPAKVRRRMHALFRDAGIGDDRTARLEFASQVIGRTIDSSNELTPADVTAVIKALEAVTAEPKEGMPDGS